MAIQTPTLTQSHVWQFIWIKNILGYFDNLFLNKTFQYGT